VPRCRNCNVTLTYHTRRRVLICHYCGYAEHGWDECPRCSGTNIEYVGSGTQKIEDFLTRKFPEVVCARLDRDATRKKGSTEALLTDFSNGLVGFLVGTQMVAKGHDFKRVGLVVVVNADVSMNLPDFRSGERTFQILTQVAGRAGRGDIPGRVLIQTYNPDHHSLAHVSCHDFKGFYRDEIDFRQELRYPPFGKLVRVVAESRKQSSARGAAAHFATTAKDLSKRVGMRIDVVGPSRTPISKVKNVYRWHTILKGEKDAAVSAFVRKCLDRTRSSSISDAVRFSIDVDPQTMM
jgi:primosomal protein N' (replication factor Y)